MIGFINKFVEALSDQELDFLRQTIWNESEKRAAIKRATFGSGLPELNEEEKSLARINKKIDAIRAYRDRTGQYLKQSKDAVEDFLSTL